jgi:hypothetical protein
MRWDVKPPGERSVRHRKPASATGRPGWGELGEGRAGVARPHKLWVLVVAFSLKTQTLGDDLAGRGKVR